MTEKQFVIMLRLYTTDRTEERKGLTRGREDVSREVTYSTGTLGEVGGIFTRQ